MRTLSAIRALRNRRCDLLVERLERRLGGCVDEDNFMAVGGRESEEDWDRRHGCFVLHLWLVLLRARVAYRRYCYIQLI